MVDIVVNCVATTCKLSKYYDKKRTRHQTGPQQQATKRGGGDTAANGLKLHAHTASTRTA